MGNLNITLTVKELKSSVVGRARVHFGGGFASVMVKLEKVGDAYHYVSPMKGRQGFDLEGAMMEEALYMLEQGSASKVINLGNSGKLKLSFVTVEGNEVSIKHFADGTPVEQRKDDKEGFFSSAVSLRGGPAMSSVRRALAGATYTVKQRAPRAVKQASNDAPAGL